MSNGDDNGDLDAIERQLDKLEQTATNLETLASIADNAGQTQQATDLQEKAVEVRAQQFKLYRQKLKIDVQSPDWKALVANLELVNHSIEQSMADLANIATTINNVSQLISIAVKVLAAIG